MLGGGLCVESDWNQWKCSEGDYVLNQTGTLGNAIRGAVC